MLNLVIGLSGLLATALVSAAPDLTIGTVAYDGSSPTVNVPVSFINDGSVVGLQFDISYSTLEIAANDAVAGTGLPPDNAVFSNEWSGGTSLNVRRIVIDPTDFNDVLPDGALTEIPFEIPGLNVTQGILTIDNVVMSDALGNAVTPGFIDSGEIVMAGTQPLPSGDISGTISVPTILDGTYNIVADVTVNPGVTLTIEAGTQLLFSANTQLAVNGSLQINGQRGLPVTLSSMEASPNRGDWTGLVLNSASGGSIINYAAVEWADTAIAVTGANVTIQNSIITNYLSAGIRMTQGAGGIIETNQLNNIDFTGDGIYLEDASVDVAGNDLVIAGNRIHRNNIGINIQKHSSPLISADNGITSNNYGVYVAGVFALADNPNPVVTENIIADNNLYGYYTADFADAANVTLNAIDNWWGTLDVQSIGAQIWENADSATSPVVTYSPFLDGPNGNSTTGESPVEVDLPTLTSGNLDPNIAKQYVAAGTQATITGDLTVPAGVTLTIHAGAQLKFPLGKGLIVDGSLVVAGASGQEVILSTSETQPTAGAWQGITVNNTSEGVTIRHAIVQWAVAGVYVAGSSAAIYDSQFSGNLYGLQLISGSYLLASGNSVTDGGYGIHITGNGQFADNPMATVNSNTLSNNSNYDYYADNFGDPANVKLDARRNWWGTADAAEIATKIYDAADSASSPLVDFSRYLTSAP
jgi:hypothetical protein